MCDNGPTRWAWFGMAAALLCGCSESETSPPAEQGGLPKLAELEPGWNELRPGGATVCSRGDDYAFFAHPGDSARVVIEFEGGGACWDASSCALGSDSFDDVVDFDPAAVEGIGDHSHPDNPFGAWSHVFLPYCTGDLHWGDKRTVYDDMAIEHRGAVNARAVLDWVYENFPAPERVLVTGCSAGGYGSIGWAPYVMQQYPNVPVVQLADCAAGVSVPYFFQVLAAVWDPAIVMPSFVAALANPDLATITLTDVYIADANHFASQAFSQFNTQFDETQVSYFEDMGGGGLDVWSEGMNESMTAISAATSNFASFVASGNRHCIITHDELYGAESGGVSVLDWIARRAGGLDVDDVHCEPSCGTP